MLMNGNGLAAGRTDRCAFGGSGFGAGGSCGRSMRAKPGYIINEHGGKGADGLVYVEFYDPNEPNWYESRLILSDYHYSEKNC